MCFYHIILCLYTDPANITITPSVIVREFNQIANFTCVGFGIPVPVLKWYHDNAEIVPSTKFKLTLTSRVRNGYTESVSRFDIVNGDKSDEGDYECRGVNNIPNLIGVTDSASGRFLIECKSISFINVCLFFQSKLLPLWKLQVLPSLV